MFILSDKFTLDMVKIQNEVNIHVEKLGFGDMKNLWKNVFMINSISSEKIAKKLSDLLETKISVQENIFTLHSFDRLVFVQMDSKENLSFLLVSIS